MDIDAQIMDAMFTISRLMRDEMGYNSDFAHLSLLQIQVLIFLKNNTNTKMREIADYFKVEMPTATSIVSTLHSMKLVKREINKDDRRIVRMKLTAKGESVLHEAMMLRKKKLHKMLSYLSVNNKKKMLSITNTLIKKMEGMK